MKKANILPPDVAQNAKFRIVFERLEEYREGDIVTGSMLRETGYYQKNGMIEQVPDETPVSTDETRREAAAVGPEQVAAAIAAHEAERELVAGILGLVEGVAPPDPQDDEPSFITAIRNYANTVDERLNGFLKIESALLEAAEAYKMKGEFTGVDVVVRGIELVKEADDAKAEGERIAAALRKENADLNAEIVKLKKELEKASKPAKGKGSAPAPEVSG